MKLLKNTSAVSGGYIDKCPSCETAAAEAARHYMRKLVGPTLGIGDNLYDEKLSSFKEACKVTELSEFPMKEFVALMSREDLENYLLKVTGKLNDNIRKSLI